MKSSRFALPLAYLLALALAGCTYNAAFVCGDHDLVRMSPIKTTDISPEIQGNVPVNGGTVTSPVLTGK